MQLPQNSAMAPVDLIRRFSSFCCGAVWSHAGNQECYLGDSGAWPERMCQGGKAGGSPYSEQCSGLAKLKEAMLWLLVALVAVCASAVAAIATAKCCHRMAICVLGPDIDEIPSYHQSAKKLKPTYGTEVQVHMCNIAHVEQPAGELTLGFPTEVVAWAPVSTLRGSSGSECEPAGSHIGDGG